MCGPQVISLSTKSVNKVTYVECLYPLGGGPGQGYVDYENILTSKECDKVLRDYAKNQVKRVFDGACFLYQENILVAVLTVLNAPGFSVLERY